MKNRVFSILLAVAIAESMLGEGTEAFAKPEEKVTTLEYLSRVSEKKTIAYEDKLIARFEESHPQIQVQIQRMSMDDYNQTIQNKMASGNAPDVFIIEQSDLEKYGANGFLMDLTDTDIVNHYDGNMLSYDGKIYGAPLGVNVYVVTYNKVLFEEVDVDIPHTLTEFYDVCEKIKEAGFVPLAAGYRDLWVLMADTQAEYVPTIMKEDLNALQKLERREVRFSDSDAWRNVFQRFGRRLAYTQENPQELDWDGACSMLRNKEAAMIVSGAWTVNNMVDMEEAENFGVFILPVSENEAKNVLIYSGGGYSYAISADSSHREEAEEFVDFMTSKEAGDAYVADNLGLCVIKGVQAPAANTSLADIIALMNEGKAMAVSADADFNFQEEYRDAFQNIVSKFVLDGGCDVDGILRILDEKFDQIAGK